MLSRCLAITLRISAEMLVFDENERGPAYALRYQFETISRMSSHEQATVRELLDAIIVKHQVSWALDRIAKPAAKENNALKDKGS